VLDCKFTALNFKEVGSAEKHTTSFSGKSKMRLRRRDVC